MADVFRTHGASVFTARGVDVDLLDQWVSEDIADRRTKEELQEAMKWVRVERKHVETAAMRSNNSSPGPDGAPYLAWRLLCGDAITVLYEALQTMTEEDRPFWMSNRYKGFNHSFLLFFL